jgi:hypothetical protein
LSRWFAQTSFPNLVALFLPIFPGERDEEPAVFVDRPITLSDLLEASVIAEAIQMDRMIVRIEFHLQGRLLPEVTPIRWATSQLVLPSLRSISFKQAMDGDNDGELQVFGTLQAVLAAIRPRTVPGNGKHWRPLLVQGSSIPKGIITNEVHTLVSGFAKTTDSLTHLPRRHFSSCRTYPWDFD